MGIINSNISACGLVEKYIGTAYDNVKFVADNMQAIIDAGSILIGDGSAQTNEDLHAYTGDVTAAYAVTVGFKALGDGGEGVWAWDESCAKVNANLGTIIDPSVAFTLEAQGTGGGGTGCWVRAFSGPVIPRWWGAVGDGFIDDTAALQAMFDFVNKDSDFAHTMSFGVRDKRRGIGEVPAVELVGEDVYLITATLVVSTHATIIGNGASLLAGDASWDASGARTAMMEIRYDFNDDNQQESYGTLFVAIANLKFSGAYKVPVGLLLDRTNWAKYENIHISECTNIGLKLEECQYSVFNNIYSYNHGNYEGTLTGTGIHLGNTPENNELRCIDLTFIGCGFNRNGLYGIHIGNAISCTFIRVDTSRNKDTSILLNNDNGDGTVCYGPNRGNIFQNVKMEFSSDDKPQSGFAINIDQGYNNIFDNCKFSHHKGTDGIEAYFKWCRNNGRNNHFLNPRNEGQTEILVVNPNPPQWFVDNGMDDISLFQCNVFEGLTVHSTAWTFPFENISSLAIAESALITPTVDPRIEAQSTEFALFLDGTFRYYSQETKSIIGKIGLYDSWYYRDQALPALGIGASSGGTVYFGDGVNDLVNGPRISNNGSSELCVENARLEVLNGNVAVNSGAWDQGHFEMGNHHLWIDATGNLRIKNGAPISDTDGVTVGSQV